VIRLETIFIITRSYVLPKHNLDSCYPHYGLIIVLETVVHYKDYGILSSIIQLFKLLPQGIPNLFREYRYIRAYNTKVLHYVPIFHLVICEP
jgi:hypothetical protein